jgi:hypothetical protein
VVVFKDWEMGGVLINRYGHQFLLELLNQLLLFFDTQLPNVDGILAWGLGG